VIAAIAVLLFLARTSIAPSGDPASDHAAAKTPPARNSPAAYPMSLPQGPARAAPRLAEGALGTGEATADTPDAGQGGSQSLPMIGRVATLAQGFALGEALSKNAANADAYVDRLCAESRALRERPALRDSHTRERDAAAFMAPLIDHEKPLDDPPGRLHLPDELRARINSYGPDWTQISDRDLAGLDFSWMSALRQFDHWTVLGAGRLRDVPLGNVYRDPIPNYVSLMLWSKLRFALGIRRGDSTVASAEVRHLADLIRSQGILLGEMIAVALYKMDARARELAAAAGADVADWGELEADHLERYRRTTFASIFFTFPGVSPATVKKALGCMPSPCVALAEGAGANRSFGAYGATDNLTLVEEMAASHRCEDALIARAVGSQEVAAGDALEGAAAHLDERIPNFLGSAN
jgi:hypothetical protein